jgi:hypothetical protein
MKKSNRQSQSQIIDRRRVSDYFLFVIVASVFVLTVGVVVVKPIFGYLVAWFDYLAVLSSLFLCLWFIIYAKIVRVK